MNSHRSPTITTRSTEPFRPRTLSMMNFLIKQNANNEEYVKNMLFSSNKEDAIKYLKSMVPFIDRNAIKNVYLKILPVYFSHAEIFGVGRNNVIDDCIHVIDAFLNNKTFDAEKRLFRIWKNRLMKVGRALRRHEHRKVDACNVRVDGYRERNEEFSSNEFVVIAGQVNPIGYTDIDFFNGYHRWLKYHKLHKYLFFFGNLSCEEISSLNEDNIRFFEEKINIIGMTNGARNAILRKLQELENRQNKLRDIITVPINYFHNPVHVDLTFDDLNQIIRTPIQKVLDGGEEQLVNLLLEALARMTYITLELKSPNIFEKMESLLKKAWPKYYFNDTHKEYINFFKNDLSTKKMKKIATVDRAASVKKHCRSNSNINLPKSTNVRNPIYFKLDNLNEENSYWQHLHIDQFLNWLME